MMQPQRIRNTEQRDGFTLVQARGILLVVLSMNMLPQLGEFNRLEREVELPEDLSAPCATTRKLADELTSVGSFFGGCGPYFHEITAAPWGGFRAFSTLAPRRSNDIGIVPRAGGPL